MSKDTLNATQQWLSKIKSATKAYNSWSTEAKEAEVIFRSQKKSKRKRFNVLHSNVQTMKRAVYGGRPNPDVRRRFADENPVGRQVAELMERAISFSLEANSDYDFDATLKSAVLDALLPGRGTARVDYIPYTQRQEGVEPTKDENGEDVYPEELVNEEAVCKFVYWRDFIHEPARKWEDVTWLAYRHQWSKEDANENGIDPDVLKFTAYSLDGEVTDEEETEGIEERAEVWEVWDKTTRQVHLVQEGQDDYLKTTDDPYGFRGFFNCPCPMYLVQANDSLEPVCEYSVYKSLADDLENVTTRLYKLTNYIKAVGVYDKTNEELATLFTSKDGTMIGAENYSELQEKGGLTQAVQFLPIEGYIQALAVLENRRRQILDNIYEITGISDIMRGTSTASESATAQRIKGNFGTLRLKDKQDEVARFARDIIRLKGELIAEKFDAATLAAITGQDVTEDMIKILRSDLLRSYNVDIETDSTIVPDEAAAQEAMTKLLGGVTTFITGMAPAVQTGIVTQEQVTALLREALRTFKMGRIVENVMDNKGEEGVPAEDNGAQLGQAIQHIQGLEKQLAQAQQVLQANNAEIAKVQADDEKHKREVARDIQKHTISENVRKELEMVKLGEKRVEKMADMKQNADLKLIEQQPMLETEAEVKEVAQQIAMMTQAVIQGNQAIAENMAAQNNVMVSMIEKLTAPKEVVYDEQGRAIATRIVEGE